MTQEISDNIIYLAEKFANKLGLNKTAGKKPMSRNTIQKAIIKAKKQHDLLKRELDSLEADDSKLKSRLEDTKSKLHFTRKQLLNMHRGMQHMDLANADDAVFYDDDEQIGYVVKGKEYHLDINDDGEITLTPMNKYRREQRANNSSESDSEAEDSENSSEIDSDTRTISPEDLGQVSDDDLMGYLHSSLMEE